jgi:hypothetical protein
MSATSVAHFETGARTPDTATVVRYCRAAHAAGRLDLAEVFASAVPGIAEGLFIPIWRLPQSELEPAEQPQTAVEESTSQAPRPATRWETILETMNVLPHVEKLPA